MRKRFRIFLVLLLGVPFVQPSLAASPLVRFDPQALVEALPLALEAGRIRQRAAAREARHRAELRARGLAEVPASSAMRYRLHGASLEGLGFDVWGKFYIDRRFVTDEEMKTVRAIEAWFSKWIFHDKPPDGVKPRKESGGAGLPVFCGFEDAHYQQHDALIARLVAEFNADKATGCGGTAAQAAKVPDLTAALVKSQMIEESGGGGASSLAAWECDPLQVNVPGDWGDEKRLVGLSRPARRNEGTLENNVRAAIRYLSRKGFGTSGQPAAKRPAGYFDSWQDAIRRYNGRRDRTGTDRYYSDEYAEKVLQRAGNPDLFVPIEIKVK